MTLQSKPEVKVLSRLITAHFALQEAARVVNPDTEEHVEMRLAIESWQLEVRKMMLRLADQLGLPPIPGVPTVAQWQNLFQREDDE